MRITTDGVRYFLISGDRIYYDDIKYSGLYKIHCDGTGLTKLIDAKVG